MKRLAKWIFILLLCFIVIGLVLPSKYHISKHIEIAPTFLSCQTLSNDLTHWQTWSPWQVVDPQLSFTLGNKTAGVGAHLTWHSKIGQGQLIITKANRQGVHFNIIYQGEYLASSSITYQGDQHQAKITWQIQGSDHHFILAGYRVLFIKYLVESNFALGLKNLKSQIEIKCGNIERQ